ncbi:MAG: HD domain-containing protein [Ignavibacteriaceae bacterium]|nr:HD domain-containing protein [Ignavibacteriaceae bacterium]
MLKQTDLLSLNKGDAVDHFLIVRKCELRMSKANKQFLALELADKTLSVNSNMFESFEEIYSKIKVGDIVKVKGTIEDYQGSPQIKVKSINPAKFSDDVSHIDFLAKSKRNLQEMKEEFAKRCEIISNVKLKLLMKSIFTDENFEKFSMSPAGKSWHHSYIHGLLEHTLEIVKICDLMCDFHPEINRDLLICGAMLHDYGKIEELGFETGFEYTDKGKLIGHIVISAMLVEEKIKEIKDFPDDLKNCLVHLILSHQGKLEYASPVVPKTLEAITLYQADELSAKVNAYKNALALEMKSESKWTKFISLAETDLYNHRLRSENEMKINESLFD